MTETELVEFLRTRMRVRLDISEGFDPYGRGPFNAKVQISLADEDGKDEVLLCEDACSFIVED